MQTATQSPSDGASLPGRPIDGATPRTTNGQGPEQRPWNDVASPVSRQLLWEVSRLAIAEGIEFREKVEQLEENENAEYEQALQEAASKHENVRQTAEAVRAEYERKLRYEREERQRQEILRMAESRRAAEERGRAIEQETLRLNRQADAEREAAAAARREHAALVEKQRLAAEARESEKRESENRMAELRAQLKAEKAEAQAQAASPKPFAPPKPSAPPEARLSTPSATKQNSQSQSAPTVESNRVHQRYQQIHQNLKGLRRFVVNEGKKNKAFKEIAGDSRRNIKKCVGQLTADSAKNKTRLHEIANTLKKALSHGSPQVNVAEYLYSPPSDIGDGQGPALLVYLLNIFAKALIAQFINESGVEPKTANALGILGTSVFSLPDFQWNGHFSFIDVLVAKYHVACPVLFGVAGGDESTAAGKQRLGWLREGGQFVTDQRHMERMIGLGAGFASLSLRNFDKSRLTAPLPHHNWWLAAAAITNVPGRAMTQTHLVVLKSMIEHHEYRIMEFWGDFGKHILRRALVEVPARPGVKGTVAGKSLAYVVDALAKDKKLYL